MAMVKHVVKEAIIPNCSVKVALDLPSSLAAEGLIAHPG